MRPTLRIGGCRQDCENGARIPVAPCSRALASFAPVRRNMPYGSRGCVSKRLEVDAARLWARGPAQSCCNAPTVGRVDLWGCPAHVRFCAIALSSCKGFEIGDH